MDAGARRASGFPLALAASFVLGPAQAGAGSLAAPGGFLLAAAPAEAAGPHGSELLQVGMLFLVVLLTGVVVFLWWLRIREGVRLQARLERERTLERRYTKLTENAADLIATLDAAGRITSLNRVGLLWVEKAPGDAVGRRLSESWNTADRAPFESAVEEALRGGEPAPFEVRLPRPDGSVLDLDVAVRACGLDGGPPEVQCIARDITSRKRIEAAAREAILRQRIHVQNTPLGVIEWNERFEVVAWNPAAERIFGWSAADALGRTAEFLVPNLTRRTLEQRWRALLERPELSESVESNRTRSGRDIECRWHHTPLVSPEGRVVGVTSLVQDVTRERLTSRLLAESEEQHRLVLSSLAEGVLVMDRDGRVLSANEAAGRIAGVDVQAAREGAMADWGVRLLEESGQETDWPRSPLGRVLGADADSCDWRMGLVRRDGRTVWLSGHVHQLPDSSGRLAGMRIVSFADITAERESARRREVLEVQLRQSQKMESLGTLAGGVAHDFNNVLAMILGNAELLRGDVHGEEDRQRLEDIVSAARRGAEVVSRILIFSRPHSMTRIPVCLSQVVGDVLQLIRVSLPPGAEVPVEVVGAERSVLGDPAALRQMLLNLMTNAVHALEGRPTPVLRLRVETVRIDPTVPYLLGTLPEGPAVRLAVEDNGSGMEPEVLRRLFEPFFTTKPPGKGTGLGLAVVHGIVQAHDGAVRVESRPGRGTRFEIDFPCGPETRPEKVPSRPAETPFGREERVLLVDDEVGVLDFARTALLRLGYAVEAFEDPREALERLRAEPDGFDLVLTDLSMPHLNGAELTAEVRRIRPDLPVVLASGYAARGELEDGAERNFAAMLGKPFGIGELGRTLRGVLDARGEPVGA